MKINEVKACSFSSWYPNFKDITIKSCILPIPQEFLEYLLADGVVLPEQSVSNSILPPDEDDIEGEDLDVDWDTDEPSTQTPSFPEFEKAIKKEIKKLGGLVFPKLNWSAPRDAHWISYDKTLGCTCPSDVYLLLKSSEFITHDLTQPFLKCEDCEEQNDVMMNFELVLRKYQSMSPGFEFRCFVKDKHLIAISQRHHTLCYEYIKPSKEDIVADIKSFYYHIIANKFPLQNYVFDVYRRDRGKLLLIDFNPFGPVTDSLLFSWEELKGNVRQDTNQTPESGQGEAIQESENSEQRNDSTVTNTDVPTQGGGVNDSREKHEIEEVIFRFVEESEGVQPHPYTNFGIPEDVKHLASGEDPHKFIDLLNLRNNIQGQGDSSDEDSEEDT